MTALRSDLGGLVIKTAMLAAKTVKLVLAAGSFAAYAWLFTWQFSLVILSMLVIHESGHLAAMKHYGMKTRGIYLIPFLGAAAVADEMFPARRTEALVALAGPVTGAALAGLAALGWAVTGSGFLAAVAAWFALVNLFNLLPVVPLDGGRVLKSVTHSLNSKLGVTCVTAGLVLGAVLAVTQGLIIFAIIIPLGIADYAGEKLLAKHSNRKARKLAAESVGRLNERFPGLPPITVDDFMAGLDKHRKPPPAPPPMSRPGLTAAFAGYAALAVVLWLLVVAMSAAPGAAAAMHALQG